MTHDSCAQIESTGSALPMAHAATIPAFDAALPDDVLVAGGLRKVNAFIRAEPSANAVRIRRARKKAEENGNAQINVLAPVCAHQTIKELAKALQAGRSAQSVFEGLLTATVTVSNPEAVVIVSTKPEVAAFERFAKRLASLTGWRRFVARLVGLI